MDAGRERQPVPIDYERHRYPTLGIELTAPITWPSGIVQNPDGTQFAMVSLKIPDDSGRSFPMVIAKVDYDHLIRDGHALEQVERRIMRETTTSIPTGSVEREEDEIFLTLRRTYRNRTGGPTSDFLFYTERTFNKKTGTFFTVCFSCPVKLWNELRETGKQIVRSRILDPTI